MRREDFPNVFNLAGLRRAQLSAGAHEKTMYHAVPHEAVIDGRLRLKCQSLYNIFQLHKSLLIKDSFSTNTPTAKTRLFVAIESQWRQQAQLHRHLTQAIREALPTLLHSQHSLLLRLFLV